MATFPLVTAEAQATAHLGVIPATVDPAKLREELRQIAGDLGKLFSDPLGLPLKSLEVDLTITAQGSVGFLGTGGTLSGSGCIKLTFEHPSPKGAAPAAPGS